MVAIYCVSDCLNLCICEKPTISESVDVKRTSLLHLGNLKSSVYELRHANKGTKDVVFIIPNDTD